MLRWCGENEKVVVFLRKFSIYFWFQIDGREWIEATFVHNLHILHCGICFDAIVTA